MVHGEGLVCTRQDDDGFRGRRRSGPYEERQVSTRRCRGEDSDTGREGRGSRVSSL